MNNKTILKKQASEAPSTPCMRILLEVYVFGGGGTKELSWCKK
jgi:hypothetical protein